MFVVVEQHPRFGPFGDWRARVRFLLHEPREGRESRVFVLVQTPIELKGLYDARGVNDDPSFAVTCGGGVSLNG